MWGHPLQEPLQGRPLPSSSLPGAGARVQLLDSVSQLSAPARKGHQRIGPPACCARGSDNPLLALGRRDSGTEQCFRSSSRNTWYLAPSGNAQRIVSPPGYQHWTLPFPYLVFPSILDAEFTSSKFLSCAFPGGSVVKNPPANTGDTDSIPGWGRSPGEENGYPL